MIDNTFSLIDKLSLPLLYVFDSPSIYFLLRRGDKSSLDAMTATGKNTLTKEFCAQPLRQVWLSVCTKNRI